MNSDLVRCLDLSERALRKVFINAESYYQIAEWFLSSPTIYQFNRPTIQDTQSNILHDTLYVCTFEKVKHEWISYSGILNLKIKHRVAIEVLRFMLGNPYLALTKGICISQAFLGSRIQAEQYKVSRAISYLKKLEWMKQTENYVSGIKGNKYVLTGEAADVAKAIYQERCGRAFGASRELPTAIQDGTWNQTLLENTKWFKDPEEWMDWIFSISGSEEKDRTDKAISIWNKHATNNGLKYI